MRKLWFLVLALGTVVAFAGQEFRDGLPVAPYAGTESDPLFANYGASDTELTTHESDVDAHHSKTIVDDISFGAGWVGNTNAISGDKLYDKLDTLLDDESDPVWVADSNLYLKVADEAVETDPVWVAQSNLYLKTESDPIWVAVSNTYLQSFTEVDPVWAAQSNLYLKSYTETDPVWTAVSNTYLQSFTEVDPEWSGVSNLYLKSESDPLWVAQSNLYLKSYTETDPVWSAVSNTYLKSYSETDPIWSASSNLYLKSYTETDPVWSASSNLYLKSYTETDPVWSAVSNLYLQSYSETDPVWTAVSNTYLQSYSETDPVWVAVSNLYLKTADEAAETDPLWAPVSNLYYKTADYQATYDADVDTYVDGSEQGVLEVWNDTGAQLDEGDVVYISGFKIVEDLPEVDRADSDSSSTMPAIGIIKEDLSHDASGWVVTGGSWDGDTSVFSVKDILYVSGTPGELTTVAPVSPAIRQRLGSVVRDNPINGVISVYGSGSSEEGEELDPVWAAVSNDYLKVADEAAETDPVWTAVSNTYLQSYAETDPVWTAVSNTYLQSYTETDPVWSAVSNDYVKSSTFSNDVVLVVSNTWPLLDYDSTDDGGAGSGESNTVSNIGGGTNLFFQKTGVDFEFKTLIDGTNTSFAVTDSNITINVTGDGYEADTTYLDDLPTFTNNVSNTVVAIWPTVGSSGGESNTVSNIGGGTNLFHQKTGVDFEFKTLLEGSNITFAVTDSNITINATGGGSGESNTVSNIGGGTNLFHQKAGVDFEFKSLIPGSNTTFAVTDSNITVNVADYTPVNIGGGTNLYVGPVAGEDVYQVTGSLTPDVTGDFTEAGTSGSKPYYTNGSGHYLQWNNVYKWCLDADTLDPDDSTPDWYQQTAYSGDTPYEGDYDANFGSGTATVTLVPGASSDAGFRSLLEGTNITFAVTDSNITINATSGGGGGETNTASNIGGGTNIFHQKTALDLEFKTLLEGSNTTFAVTDSNITINVTAGGGSGDLTEVQVNGGLLSVATGTGPIPDVGLSTNAISNAVIGIWADLDIDSTDDIAETTGSVRTLRYVISGTTNATIDAENGYYQQFTATTNVTFAYAGSTNLWNTDLLIIGADAYTTTWGGDIGWTTGDGTIEGPKEEVLIHGSNTTAIAGAELDNL